MTPLTGKPPPNPLPTVMMSGLTPDHSLPKRLPVRSKALLELRTHEAQDALRLAMEAAPERNHLEFLGVRARQAQRRFHRLGAARVQLRLDEPGAFGCERRNALEERAPGRRRVTAD